MEKSIVVWETLPDEIQREIASYLKIKSLCFFAASSKRSLKNALPFLLQHQQKLERSSYLSIVTGDNRSIFVSDVSTGLYGCGQNYCGQLGLGHNDSCNTFTPITSLKGKVLQVAIGEKHTLVLTDQGLFACGRNDHGQLGLGHNKDCNIFTPVTSLKGKVLQMTAGSFHTVVLTDLGLWVCGNTYNPCNTFTQVKSLKGKVLYVTAGDDCTLALTDRGLWVWGRNPFGQFGVGHNKDCTTFTLIQSVPKGVKVLCSLYRHIDHLKLISKHVSERTSSFKRPISIAPKCRIS